MGNKVPPVPFQAKPINDLGLFNQIWSDWFKQIFARVGGSTASSISEIDDAITEIKLSLVPSGSVIPFAGSSAPSGYLMCDGAAVSRVTYAKLFTAIGVAHGSGDGTSTFNLPDYRGRFLRGVDGSGARDPGSAGRTAMATGGATGNNVGSVQGNATAYPTLPFTTDSQGSHSGHWSGTPAAILQGAGASINVLTVPAGPTTLGAHTHTISGGDLETRPINAYVNWLVKT